MVNCAWAPTLTGGGQLASPLKRMTAMSKFQKQPSKEAVRKWLHAQIATRRPPPDAQQIRRELGWELLRLPRDTKR